MSGNPWDRGYVWDLSVPDGLCDWRGRGHWLDWILFTRSMRNPSVVVPVTASVDDDGLVHVEGDGLSLVRWNHRPALVRAALENFAGMAEWKPSWDLLVVPAESFWGSVHSVFHLAAPGQRSDCRVDRRVPRDDPPPRAGTEAYRRWLERAWAEQEARNAELHDIDYSHIPPLRVADRYARGRRKRN